MKRIFAILAAVFGLLGPVASLAQPAPLIIDQNRADRSPPTSAPQVAAPNGSGRVEAAPATFTPFVLKSVRVQGSTLSQAALAEAWRPFLGRTVDSAELGQIAQAVGAVYAKSDVALYTILVPRQPFTGGAARLVAVEGYVSDVDVTSDPGHPPPRQIRAYGRHLQAEKPLRRSSLERYVALMRDIPGATVDVQFLQGGKPGAVKLAIKAKRQRFQTSLSVNNRGLSYLGRTQIEASLSANSLFREGDQTRLTVAAPTEVQRFQFVGLSQTEPLGDDGMNLNLNAGYLRTRPKIAGVELTGHATTAGGQVTYPLIRSNTRNLFLTGGVDGVNSDNAIFGQRFSADRTRSLRLAAAYSQQSAKQALSASVTFSQGLDILGAHMSNPASGDEDFSKVNALASLSRQFGQWSVRLAGTAQYAATSLPATEVLALGGAQFGRGFASAVITGQSGYAVSGELAWRVKPILPKLAGTEVYGFADHGKVFNAYGPVVTPNYTLASAGGGVRAVWKNRNVIELEVAKAVDGPPGVSREVRLAINVRTQV